MGEYAFPMVVKIDDSSTGYHHGMTLRDWFAGQALAGLLGNPQLGSEPSESWAEASYNIADAMLAARNNNTTDK